MGGLTFPSTAYRMNSLIHSGDALLPSYNIPVRSLLLIAVLDLNSELKVVHC
jgi:hypothetical protein